MIVNIDLLQTHSFSNSIDPSSVNSTTKRHRSNKPIPNKGLVSIAKTGTSNSRPCQLMVATCVGILA
jgi:hypothetical protein